MTSLFRMLAFSAVLVLDGCGPAKSASAPQKPNEEPKKAYEAPKPPEEKDKDAALASTVIVKEESAAAAQQKSRYVQEIKLSCGSVGGMCFVPFKKLAKLPDSMPLGELKDPQPGEAETYKATPPKIPLMLGPYVRWERHGVTHALITLRGVKTGKRPAMTRPGFMLDWKSGQFSIAVAGHNHGAGSIALGPLGERVQFLNTEFYPCMLAVTHVASGKVVFEDTLPGYSDPKYPSQRWGTNPDIAPLPRILTSNLKDPGVHAVTCKRHPWHKCHVVMLDHPSATVCVPHHAGGFSMPDVPVGKYTLDVWHPAFEPVKNSFEIEVTEGRLTELMIEFKEPKILSEAEIIK